ncbi:substrate-binding domain-containing protein [Caldivirga sp. UBA161]|uniref:substrate-binding domain-containing protein n=1 Tax=Caldivirga sp. UBA161 TaxID=1915569 RepID=UPI0025C07508|nr:substrate-binding domain-containing protein [Caldivirga sp. UBA161]
MASNSILAAAIVVALIVGVAAGYGIASAHVGKVTSATTLTSITTVTLTTTSPVTVTVTHAPSLSQPFIVGAAGTLKFAFTDLLNIMKGMYPGLNIGQPYFKGSGDVAQYELQTNQLSIMASADTTTIPSVLFTHNYTDYEIAFGVTQMVIIVDLNTTAGQEVYRLWQEAQSYPPLSAQWNNTWREIFTIIALNSSTVVGVSNPFTDPSGYQAQCMIKLAGLAFFNNASYLYDAIYGHSSKYFMRNTEIDLFTLMQAGQIQFILSAYLSNALPQTQEYKGTAYITLPPMVNLGNLSYVPYYHQVNVTWTEVGVTKTFICNPVVYTVTIPKNAPNPTAALYFLTLLYSPIGQKILEENGIQPIVPGIVYGNYSNVPAILRPFTAPVSQYPQYAPIFP